MEGLQDLLPLLARHGSRPAVIAWAEAGARILTYDQLLDQALRLAAGLTAQGIGRASRVGLYAPASPEAVVVHIAVIAAGAVTVNFGGEMSGPALQEALHQTGCAVLFTTRALAGQEGWDDGAPLPIYCLDGDGPGPSSLQSWTGLLAGRRAEPTAVEGSDIAAVFFTSGTTGPPKQVPLSHGNLVAALNALLSLGVVRPEDRVLLPLPLYHVYPFIVGLLVPLAAGSAVVLPEGLEPGQIRRALGQADITTVVGVPRLYEAILAGVEGRIRGSGRLAAAGFAALMRISGALGRALGPGIGRWLFSRVHRELAPHLRIIVSGGAKLEARVASRLVALGWQVMSGYGLAETAALGCFNVPGATRYGSAGRPAPNVAVRIDEPDAEGVGEVLISGPSVFDGYPGAAEATKTAFTEDKWFRTGDLGFVDTDGFLHVTGRTKEIIVLADGKNVAPEELEKIYGASPYIGDLGILERGGLLHAIVVPDLDQIRRSASRRIDDIVRISLAELAEGLASHLRLSGFVLTTEPLPRTPLGKLRRFLLPELYEGGAATPAPAVVGPEDRALLAEPRAAALWDWLAARFPDRPLSLDMNPQLDLGIDSLAWIGLGMEIERAIGVPLPDDVISQAVTLRDLITAVAVGPGLGAEGLVRELADRDRWLPSDTRSRPVGAVVYAVAWLGVRSLVWLRVRGLEQVPRDGPVVLVSNHVSILDPFVLGIALGLRRLQRAGWATSAEILLEASPFVRWFARLAHAFPVSAWAAKTGLVLARSVLEEGRILVWFPEEWRSPTGALQRFRPGIGRLLQGRDLAVIPAYIDGTFAVLPRTRRLPRPGRVTVTFGAPLRVKDLEAAGAGKNPETRIASALQQAVAALAPGDH